MTSSALRSAVLAVVLLFCTLDIQAQAPPGQPDVAAPAAPAAPEAPVAPLFPAAEPAVDHPSNGSDLAAGLNSLSGSSVPGGHGGGLGTLISPVVGHAQYRASYGFTEYFNERVQTQGTSFGFFRENAQFSGPIWQDDHNEWTASTHVREEAFHTGGTILPNTGQPFPNDLWNIGFGTGFRHLFDNGWIAGGNVSVGSASDEPFHGIKEMTVGVNASLRIPSGERNAWLFTLNYSATSEVNFPIPGVAFLYNPNDCFQAVIGFPFISVNYRPTEDLTLSVSYAILTNFNARATYRVVPWMRLYGAFNVENESYFRVGRVDDRDRLFYYDDKLTVGALFPFNRSMSLDVSTGYVFDRYYFEGRTRSDTSNNRINIGDGPFIGANLQFRF
jgi:hypothetical protein